MFQWFMKKWSSLEMCLVAHVAVYIAEMWINRLKSDLWLNFILESLGEIWSVHLDQTRPISQRCKNILQL